MSRVDQYIKHNKYIYKTTNNISTWEAIPERILVAKIEVKILFIAIYLPKWTNVMNTVKKKGETYKTYLTPK